MSKSGQGVTGHLRIRTAHIVRLVLYFCSGEIILKEKGRGFPGGAVVENLPANAGDTGSSPGLGRSHMPRSN